MHSGLSMLAMLLMMVPLNLAPFQCASDPDPNRRVEDTAPEALWTLAAHFESRGDDAARNETLEYLVRQYPRSRFAHRAADELGIPAPSDDTADEAPNAAEDQDD